MTAQPVTLAAIEALIKSHTEILAKNITEALEKSMEDKLGLRDTKLETMQNQLLKVAKHINLDLDMPELVDLEGKTKEDILQFLQNDEVPEDVLRTLNIKKPYEGFIGHSKKKIVSPALDSDDEDERENDLEKNWIEERRLKTGHNPYSSLPEYKLKADIPNFSGNFRIEELIDWFFEVESFFEFMEVPEDSKVKLVTYKLKGGAAAWWDKICDDRRNANKPKIRTWKRMKTLIRDKSYLESLCSNFSSNYKTFSRGHELLKNMCQIFIIWSHEINSKNLKNS